jgi:hypothetical protein
MSAELKLPKIIVLCALVLIVIMVHFTVIVML